MCPGYIFKILHIWWDFKGKSFILLLYNQPTRNRWRRYGRIAKQIPNLNAKVNQGLPKYWQTDGRPDRRISSIHKPELLCNPAKNENDVWIISPFPFYHLHISYTRRWPVQARLAAIELKELPQWQRLFDWFVRYIESLRGFSDISAISRLGRRR